jgi:4-hydroxybenzoate polyprenyltransferase
MRPVASGPDVPASPRGAIGGRVFRLGPLIRLLRLPQWSKNFLLFAPVVLAHRYMEWPVLRDAALAWFSFGLCASAVYVVNDMRHVEVDRHHPSKCRRPFAAGQIPLSAGFVIAPVVLLAGLATALALPPVFLVVVVAYLVLTTLYTFLLKEQALVDVLALAALYSIRIIAGGAATGIAVSEWLLAFSIFVFLSLGAVKRYTELLRLSAAGTAGAKVHGRGYFVEDRELILPMGVSSGLIAVLVLALYLSSATVTKLYARPGLLWLVCPGMLYWVTRTWLLAHRGEIEDDPLSFTLRDPVTWILALLGLGAVVAAGREW